MNFFPNNKKIILNRPIFNEHFTDGYWQLNNGFKYYKWVYSSKKNRFYLIKNVNFHNLFMSFLFFIISCLGTYIMWLFFNLTISSFAGILIGFFVVYFIRIYYNFHISKLPKKPLIILDIAKEEITFYARKNMACMQISENKLLINFNNIKKIELYSNISIQSEGKTISQVIGHAPFFALYITINDSDRDYQELICIGVRMSSEVYDKIVKCSGKEFSKYIGFNIP